MAAHASAAPVGRRRFWGTVICFALGNLAAWAGHVRYDQARHDPRLLRVEQFRPGDGQTISGHPVFSWTFNLDAAPASSPGATQPAAATAAGAAATGAISPATPGRWAWRDGRTLTFTPDADLPKATRFSFTLHPDSVRTPGGFRLAQPFVAAVQTAPLEVRAVRQAAFDEGRMIVELTFNDAVLPADLLQHLTLIGPDGRLLKCAPYGEATGNVVRVRTDPIPVVSSGGAGGGAGHATVTVDLSPGLVGGGGPLGLATGVQRVLAVGSDLMATDASAYWAAPGEAALVVAFNNPVDVEALRQVLTVEPAMPFRVSRQYNGVRLAGGFQPATRYAIKIAAAPAGAGKGAAAAGGADAASKFPRPGVLSVFVPDRPASVWFEHDDGYLGAAGNRTVMAHATNVTAVRATVTRVYDNNLIAWRNAATGRRRWADPAAYGRPLASRRIELSREKNKTVDLPLSLDELLPAGAARDGVYQVTLAAEGDDAPQQQQDDRPHSIDGDDDYRPSYGATSMVTLSDIGLSAKRGRDGVTAWAVSLRTARPLPGVRLRLFSDKGQLLSTATTGDDGLARLESIHPAPGERAAVLLADHAAAEQDGGTEPATAHGSDSVAEANEPADLTWLDLRTSELAFGESDIAGRPYLRSGYEAFVYTDRGVYRPGETVHLRAIVRGPDQAAAPRFPVRWQFRRPDLRDWRSQTAELNADGATGLDLPLPTDLPTGRWTASVGLSGQTGPVDRAFGSVTFQVEEFMPDRMKVAVELETSAGDAKAAAAHPAGERFRLGSSSLKARAQADYLFGRPAAELPANLVARIEPVAFQPPAWRGWTFGDAASTAEVLGASRPLGRRAELPVAQTDSKGSAAWELDIEDLIDNGEPLQPTATVNGTARATGRAKRKQMTGAANAPALAAPAASVTPWRLSVSASVVEAGGRAVTAGRQIDVDPVDAYLGVRPAETAARPGVPAAFSIALVSTDGKIAASADGEAEVTLFRETWNTSLVHADGHYRYESTRLLEPVGEIMKVALKGGRGTAEVTPPDGGAYVLRVRDGRIGFVTTCAFYATEGAWDDNISRENPEKLEVVLLPAPRGGGELLRPALDAIRRRDWKATLASVAALKSVHAAEVDDGSVDPWTPRQPRFRVGEQLQAIVRSPFPGRLLLCVETDGLVGTRVLEMTRSQMTVPIDVTDACRPNAYVTATVVRPVDPNARWQPHRAVGVARLRVDESERRLDVRVAAPAEVRPDRTLSTELHVADSAGRPVAGAALTVAAVDEGICRLTGFRTPDPFAFFTADRALGVRSADLYSQLMPEVARPEKASEIGGDSDAADARHHTIVVAKRVRPVALWSGVLHTDDQGVARAEFQVPQFTGQLRLMAVAYGGASAGARAGAPAGVGSGERAVLVRSPLLVQSSWPRFAAPGDRFVVPLVIFNNTPAAGAAKITVRMDDPAPAQVGPLGFGATKERVLQLDPVSVPGGEQVAASFEVVAAGDRVGVGRARLVAELDGQTYEESIELPVRPASPVLSDGGYAVATPDAPAKLTVPGGMIDGAGRLELRATPWPSLSLPQGLDYLERYPYGCAEQTTSTCFPLVYLGDIGRQIAPGAFDERRVAEKVQVGITRLIGMQTAGGGLAMWPGGREPWPWASVYAAHLLVEAQSAGHAVPEDFRDHLLGYLRNLLNEGGDGADLLETQAYACYVLALAGKPERAAMSRLSDALAANPLKVNTVSAPLDDARGSARVQLAAAWLAAGRRDRAAGLIPQVLPAPRAGRQLGGNVGSPVRDRAVLLSTLLQVEPERPDLPALAQELADAGRTGKWRSTQDTAFAVLALGRYLRQAKPAQPYATAELWQGDRRLATAEQGHPLQWDAASQVTGTGNADKSAPTPDPLPAPGAELQVRITGPAGAKAYISWARTGVPDHPPVAADNGLQVRRRYLDRRGNPLANGLVGSGDLVQVELTISSPGPLDYVVVEDLLPAGLEVENPRLQTTAAAEGRDRAAATNAGPFNSPRLDVRDDRLVLFGGMTAGGTGKYVYTARAVAPGTFTVPPVRAECMYDLGTNSLWGGGMLKVVAPARVGGGDVAGTTP